MIIPKIYKEILEGDESNAGTVYLTVKDFGKILTNNQLYFFEEYTNHGIQHIDAVLQATIEIIPEKSLKEFLNSDNVSVLILSIVLHDIAMHHTFKSFSYLIQQETILIPELDQFSWKELWKKYTEEAKKFSSHQKEELFGSYDHFVSIPDFKNIDELNGYDKKLIGEFIRRHHPRIAHGYGLTNPDKVL